MYLKAGIGVVLCAAIVIAVTTVRGCYLDAQRRIQEQRLARIEELTKEAFEDGRQGGNVNIGVFEAIPALAADPVCCEKVTYLSCTFFYEPLSDPFDCSSIRNLKNLNGMYFYCGGTSVVLPAAAGMQSIEELSFDCCGYTPEEHEWMASFPNLKKVQYTSTDTIARQEFDKLNQLMPNVEFVGYDDKPLSVVEN